MLMKHITIINNFYINLYFFFLNAVTYVTSCTTYYNRYTHILLISVFTIVIWFLVISLHIFKYLDNSRIHIVFVLIQKIIRYISLLYLMLGLIKSFKTIKSIELNRHRSYDINVPVCISYLI